jgi:hypothetical protein
MVENQPNNSLRTLLIIQVITLIAVILILIWNVLPLLGIIPGGGAQYQILPGSGGKPQSLIQLAPEGYTNPSQHPLSFTSDLHSLF